MKIPLLLLSVCAAMLHCENACAANLLTNPGFETGNASGWTGGYGSYAVVAGNAHSGSYSAQVNYGSAIQQTVTGLSSNTTYTCSGWFKVATAGQNVYLLAQSYGGTAVAQWASTTTYTWLTLTFKTGPTNTSALITVYQSGGPAESGAAYCDDLNLSLSAGITNYLTNPGFETGNTSGWVGGYGTCSVVAGPVHSGSYAAGIQTNSALQQVVTGLSPNTTYTCSGWFEEATAGQYGYLIANGYGDSTDVWTTAATYTQLTLTFKTGPTNTSATIVVYQSGAGLFYCDDFILH